jgi:hypothetical protein
MQRALIVEQVLDQPLQLHAVVAHDGDHLPLRRRQWPTHLIVQQLGPLPQRRERRFEFVRQMAQESVLLRLELDQPAAQPVEALAERLQILGAANLDGAREIRVAELPDGAVELGDRTRDIPREHKRRTQRDGGAEQHQQDQLPLHYLCVGAQAHHLAVRDKIADGQDLVGGFRQVAGQLADLARLDAGARPRGEAVVQRLLLRDGLQECGALRFIKRQQRQLGGHLLEAAVHACVVGRELRVV